MGVKHHCSPEAQLMTEEVLVMAPTVAMQLMKISEVCGVLLVKCNIFLLLPLDAPYAKTHTVITALSGSLNATFI